jgi:dephospho-CoA kinase
MAEKILNSQIDIEEKKIRADFIINNSTGLDELAVEVQNFLRQILI